MAIVKARRSSGDRRGFIYAGQLRERLAFVEQTLTDDVLGGSSVSTATLDTISGRVTALSGAERLTGGANESLTTWRVITRQGNLEAAAVSTTSITRSSTTATVTAAAAHGLKTGEYVRVSGANEGDYNGRFVATVTNSTAFTYAVAGSPDTPATGTITTGRLKPINATMTIAWTPSWDSAQPARTLEILAMRPFELQPGRWQELDCGEVAN